MGYILAAFRYLSFKLNSMLLAIGEKNVECVICGWQGQTFLPYGVNMRKNAQCPNCLSLERHRLIYLYFIKHLDSKNALKLLHFAPEKSMWRLFKSYKNIHYISVDIQPGAAMQVEDITNLTFEDKSFDIIYCSHVLEHVIEESKALREIRRVLKPEGYAILQVPIADQDTTFEDHKVINPSEREKIFGQRDHVRVYGRDYPARLRKGGFKVTQINFSKEIGYKKTKRFALLPRDGRGAPTEGVIYYCVSG